MPSPEGGGRSPEQTRKKVLYWGIVVGVVGLIVAAAA